MSNVSPSEGSVKDGIVRSGRGEMLGGKRDLEVWRVESRKTGPAGCVFTAFQPESGRVLLAACRRPAVVLNRERITGWRRE